MVDERNRSTERKLAIYTTFIILLVPTIGLNLTMGNYLITENSYFWPWLILVYLSPESARFSTEMYNFILPPFSLIVFIPFLISLSLCYSQFKGEDDRERTAGLIALLALFQILLIWLTYQSQNPLQRIAEDTTMLYIPQLLILLMQGGFGGYWYYNKVQKILKTPNKQKSVD